MFKKYESIVKATIAYLDLIKVKVNDSTVNKTLQNHPDWPSLLCITDSLKKWNIPSGAGKIDLNNIDQLPTPFIAYTNVREFPLAIIIKVSDSTIQIYQKNYDRYTIQNREEFIKTWKGVYLITEPTKHSGELNYKLNRRKETINSLIPVAAFFSLIMLSFLFLHTIVSSLDKFQSFNAKGIYFQYLIMHAGIVITSLLLWYEIDKNNPVLQKVCTGIVKGNCNAILTGKQSKLFNWLSWSEVGFFYFTGGMLILLLGDKNIFNSISILAWVNILALPYTIFSVYYQWKIAKQWCILCLSVQILLIVGSINAIAHHFIFPLPRFSSSIIIRALFLYASPASIWYTVKSYLLMLQESKIIKRQYLRIKFNSEIFDTLLKKQKFITISTDNLGIDIGSPSATNILVKVCNPYCGPCSKAHPKIDKLLEEIPHLKLKIIFATPNRKEELSYKPVSHLLAINNINNNEEIIKQALNDWYLSDKNYDQFAMKYPMNGELQKQSSKIEAMHKWCTKMDIHFTPTLFINGYQLPDEYNIEDLKYFLLK